MRVVTRKIVLVIDDDDDTVRLTADALVRAGYAAMPVKTASRARACMAMQPSAVIIDLQMPDVRGYELIRELCLMHACPVIVASASANESTIDGAFAVGASSYLTKPFSPEEMVGELRRLGVEP